MVRVMGKKGAFEAGGGGGHRGMDGSRKIMRGYPVREVFINVADFDIFLVGRLSKGEQEGEGGGGIF